MLCGCGCGLEVKPGRYYIQGHQGRGKSNDQRQAIARGLPVQPRQEKTILPKKTGNTGQRYIQNKANGYTDRETWKKALRRLFGPACMRCGWNEAPCDTHHIWPKHQGGKYQLENGIVLCPNCHRLADYGLITVEELRQLRAKAIPLITII